MKSTPITHPGWPDPSWKVAELPDGRVALRIIERRIETGMINLTPAAARELATALNLCAAKAEQHE